MDILRVYQKGLQQMKKLSFYNHEAKHDFKKESQRDIFTRGYRSEVIDCIYSKQQNKTLKYTAAILDLINFHYNDIQKKHGETINSFFVGGKEYLKKDIPKVDPNWCREIKAENNIISFTEGEYYKYVDANGDMHILACRKNYVGQPYSDQVTGRQNENTYRIGRFWRMMSKNGMYLTHYYSHDEQREYLNSAGINKGFFTVQIGNLRKEYFYSNGRSGVAIDKERYNDKYNMLTKTGCPMLNRCKQGTVIKIAGKEYVVNDNHKLDIPYGEDIFDIEYPLYSVENNIS